MFYPNKIDCLYDPIFICSNKFRFRQGKLRIRPNRVGYPKKILVSGNNYVSFQKISCQLGIARGPGSYLAKQLEVFESPSQPKPGHSRQLNLVEPKSNPGSLVAKQSVKIDVSTQPIEIRMPGGSERVVGRTPSIHTPRINFVTVVP